MRAVVGEDRLDAIGHRLDQATEEVGGDAAGRLLVQLRKGKLRGTVDGDEEVMLAVLGAQLGDVDVKVADGVILEGLLRLIALHLGQATDVVALEAAMQR